jgi:excisionase family DNA binding protein
MARDDDFGIVRLRAFGTFDFKIVDPKLFLKEVAGSDQHFRLDEFADTMRSRMVSVFSEALAESHVPVLDVATRYSELGEALLPIINPVVGSKYGLEITSFIVENVSVPPEVEAAIDNLNDFVKYQMAKGMESGGAGAGGTAAELAVGFGMAQQMMQQGLMNPQAQAAMNVGGAGAAAAASAVEMMAPSDVAKILGVPEVDVMAIITSGELKAKKIGASFRVTKAALDAYLAQ